MEHSTVDFDTVAFGFFHDVVHGLVGIFFGFVFDVAEASGVAGFAVFGDFDGDGVGGEIVK